ncbi:DUF397 domain-containing protein [Lentzea sp. NPDC058436]|uniref:DUF397 domain-containing protein n=1 Tax=Lentzea sp. NPDC058436 TaxID=3346499 RepID=UPI003658479C
MGTGSTRRPLAVDRSTFWIYAQVWPCRVGDLAGRATMAAELMWKRSSYSSSGGTTDCVECAGDGRALWLRDSKDRGGQRLEVSPAGWRAFLLLVRS